jgi:hypothetical protein
MEHEHELVDMWVLQFETLYGKPNHKQKKDQKFAIPT